MSVYNKIIKYEIFDDDILPGDIVVFPDDSRKTILSINGHRVSFDGFSSIDLWTAEIKGIIKKPRHSEIKTVKPVFAGIPKSIHVGTKEKKPLANSYQELYDLLSHVGPPKFYHYTEVHNAKSIIESGFIFSRDMVSNKIKFNNAEKLEMTDLMTATNKSWELKKHVRFYLNPLNAVTYAFHKCYKENNTFGVIIALPFESIWCSGCNVILTPKNAHFLPSGRFDWKTLNIGIQSNLKNYNINDFDFDKTFKRYDSNEKNDYLTAEVLFSNKVFSDLICKIYFKNEDQRQVFLKMLKQSDRNLIENKCSVERDLFW